MSSFLDNITVEPRNSNVVSEQHDVNQINVGSAPDSGKPSDRLRGQIASLQTGGWDEAEYGISRLAQIAKLEAAFNEAVAFEATPEGMEAARLAVEKALTEMRQRALNRAGLFVRNGRVSVAVAGQPAWYGLGVNVRDAMNSKEAIVRGNLDVKVLKSPLSFQGADGQWHSAEDVFALHYEDMNEHLYTVGSRYQVIQNQQAFDFVDALAGTFDAKYEAVGAINEGRKVFLLMHFPKQSFTLPGDDRQEAYILFTNTHGGEAAWCFPTNERVVCANTCRRACMGRKKGISIRHTGNVLSKIADAQEACGLAVTGFDLYKEEAEAMSRTKLPDARKYFGLVLDDFLQFTEAEHALRTGGILEAVLQMTEAERKVTEKSLESKLKHQDMLLEQILTNYEKDSNGPAGTVWRGWNSITDLTSHGKTDLKQSRDERKRAERRFESIVDGERDDLNQVAYSQALALTV